MLLGVSVGSVREALKAAEAGADYLGGVQRPAWKQGDFAGGAV